MGGRAYSPGFLEFAAKEYDRKKKEEELAYWNERATMARRDLNRAEDEIRMIKERTKRNLTSPKESGDYKRHREGDRDNESQTRYSTAGSASSYSRDYKPSKPSNRDQFQPPMLPKKAEIAKPRTDEARQSEEDRKGKKEFLPIIQDYTKPPRNEGLDVPKPPRTMSATSCGRELSADYTRYWDHYAANNEVNQEAAYEATKPSQPEPTMADVARFYSAPRKSSKDPTLQSANPDTLLDESDDGMATSEEDEEDTRSTKRQAKIRQKKKDNAKVWAEQELQGDEEPEQRKFILDHNRKVNEFLNEELRKRRENWLSNPGRLPLGMATISYGSTRVRSNEFPGMLHPAMIYVPKYNAVLCADRGQRAVNLINENKMTGIETIKGDLVPLGLPTCPLQLFQVEEVILKKGKDYQRYMFILWAFYRITILHASHLRDWTMWETLLLYERHPEWIDPANNFFPSILPPIQSALNANGYPFPPFPAEKETDMTVYIRQYIITGAPGAKNEIVGLVVNTAHCIYVPSVFGYLVAKFTSPDDSHHKGARKVYTRILAGIAAVPGHFSAIVSDWNERNPEDVMPNSTWDAVMHRLEVQPGANLDEFVIVRHLRHCGFHQRHLDTMYTWAIQYIRHYVSRGVFYEDQFAEIEVRRAPALICLGTPQPLPEYAGWYIPTTDDIERVRLAIGHELAPLEKGKMGDIPKSPVDRFSASAWRLVGDGHVIDHIYPPESPRNAIPTNRVVASGVTSLPPTETLGRVKSPAPMEV